MLEQGLTLHYYKQIHTCKSSKELFSINIVTTSATKRFPISPLENFHSHVILREAFGLFAVVSASISLDHITL